MSYNCTDCHRPIPAGTAVIRSISFRRVTWCQDCASDNHGVVLPKQRTAADAGEARWVS